MTRLNAIRARLAANPHANYPELVDPWPEHVAWLVDLVDLAREMVKQIGHKPNCMFTGCTCGATTILADKLNEFHRHAHLEEPEAQGMGGPSDECPRNCTTYQQYGDCDHRHPGEIVGLKRERNAFQTLAKASIPALKFMEAMRGKEHHEVIALREALAHPAIQRAVKEGG